jgi:hypothetical protein
VEVEERTMPFAADSPRAWVEEQGEHHPGWLALRTALPPERWAALEDEIEGILRAGNEDPAALRLSSPYLLARVDR